MSTARKRPFAAAYKPPEEAVQEFTTIFSQPAVAREYCCLWQPGEPPALDNSPDPETLSEPPELFSAEALQAEAQRLAEQMLAEETTRMRTEVREEQVAVFQQASRELLRALQREWHTRLQEVEREAGALVLEIAAKVLQRELEENSLAIVPVVKAALQQVRDQARVQVVVAPVDEPAVQAALADLQAILAQDSRLEIVVDEQAQLGGCVVHGEQSSVDARLNTRLEAVRECVETMLGAA